jgi:hypothetical protein
MMDQCCEFLWRHRGAIKIYAMDNQQGFHQNHDVEWSCGKAKNQVHKTKTDERLSTPAQ